MTLEVIFGQLYGKAYTSAYSTQLSNSLTVGTILGQFGVGIVCDVFGRKAGIVISTFAIVAGIIIVTASHGAHGSFAGFIWCFTIGRGLTVRHTACAVSCVAFSDRLVRDRASASAANIPVQALQLRKRPTKRCSSREALSSSWCVLLLSSLVND